MHALYFLYANSLICVAGSAVAQGNCCINMSIRDDFEAVLTAIQKEKDLTCQLESSTHAMTRWKEGVVVGLDNGEVVVVTIGTSIETALMTSEHGGHEGVVMCLATTPDESRAVSGSEDKTVRVWNLTKRIEEIKFEGHSQIVTCVATTPDGLRVVSGSEDNTVRVWSLADRTEEVKFEGHSESINCLAITPDATRVISGSQDNTIRVWSLTECIEEFQFEGHSDPVACVAITPDGSRVVSCSYDKTLRVWSLADRREEIKFEGHSDAASCLAITPDGSKVVSCSHDNAMRVWNLVECKEEFKFEGHSRNVICVAITPDGLRAVSGSFDNTVRVWNLAERREEIKLEGHTEKIIYLAVTPDGSKVMSASDDHTVHVWSLAEHKEEITFEGHLKNVVCVAVTPDGSKVVSGSYDETVRVWNLADHSEEIKFEDHSDILSSVAITPDGLKAVSGAYDNTVRVWNLAERREEIKFEGHSGAVICLAITPDGLRVVSGSEDATVRVWSLADNREDFRFEGHSECVRCLAVMPDGSGVVSGSDDHTVRVWSLAEHREEMKFEGHSETITCLAITPGGSRVVSGSDDKTVRVWSLAERREEIKFEGHLENVTCLVITPNGSKVISGSWDNSVRMWSLVDRTEEFKFEGHSEMVTCLAITPDGLRVASGSGDNTVRMWSLADHREECKFEGHSASVACLEITRDGLRAVSGSFDNTVRVWNLAEHREEFKFKDHSGASSRLTHTPEGLKVVYYSDSQTTTNPKQTAAVCDAMQTSSDLRAAIKEWKTGTALASSLAKCVFPSHHFNGLHVCAYYNRSILLTAYLEAGVPLIVGYFGTPLTLAMQRSSVNCVNAILQFFITRLEDPDTKDKIWCKFDMITEDLPQLLKCNSSLLHTFFGLLMRTPAYPPLPDFIIPALSLPVTMNLSSRFVNISDFDETAKEPKGEAKQGESVLVKFLISLPRWNFTAGSEQSLKLLSAFADCENKLVLATPYVSAIIEDKWNRCYAFTVIVTLLYLLLLCAINCILFFDTTSHLFTHSFLALNTFFILYELIQMFATGTVYFCELLNWVDVVRGGLSAAWVVLLLRGHSAVKGVEEVKYLTLIVVVLCYLRGFTYFRSCKMTRIFVYMTLAVVKEVYSFLIILWYSILAFGVFSAVMLEFDSMGDAWTNAYNLLMGNFDNTTYGIVEWVMFTGATMTNVVIMLNLLVSILGEAYEKTQMRVRENDLHQQLTLVIEYESMMFWRRKDAARGTVVATCIQEEGTSQTDEWQGQILQITRNVRTVVEGSIAKVSDKIDGIEKDIAGMRKIEGIVTGIEDRIAGIEKIEEKVTGIEGKIDGMEKQLQAILSLLSSKS